MLALDIGETGAVVVRIEDATNVYGVQIDLAFDANQIRVLDADDTQSGVQISAGDFLAINGGFEAANEVNNETGQLTYAYSRLSPSEPASGSGSLLEFEVEALASGSADLQLSSVILASPEGDELPVNLGDRNAAEGALIVPTFTAAPLEQPATRVMETAAPGTLRPTAATTPEPSPTAESETATTAATANPDSESILAPNETEADIQATATANESPPNTLAAPTGTEEAPPMATGTGPIEPSPAAAVIAAVPPTLAQEDTRPASEQASEELTVIGQNQTVEEDQRQPAAQAPNANNDGTMAGDYLAPGLIALFMALIAFWFLWRTQRR